ncbi:MAG: LysM peptidoglycan-binding domain-containing protein [Deltaproteobacteria bacterium]|nr:LysM peptidoglycan-binding domain-containing protein [Deltaproteobacteria bacterium]MBW2136799.1 LysM peptidoglycan-binding domain-containing protein [Deltaproteobacteria bacterium]
MKFYEKKPLLFLLSLVSVFLCIPSPGFGQDAGPAESKEDTYAISLVKTAEVDKEKDVYRVEDKKVLAETVTVVKGDHLWQIFRERGLLGKRELPVLIDALKSLNKSLKNLDLIYPGDKIIVPLTLLPVTAKATPEEAAPIEEFSPEELKDIKFEYYTVKPGDSLVKVVKGHYDIPLDTLRHEYLELVRRLNPAIQDLNLIHPGQMIRLPIYSPQVVRVPIAQRGTHPPEPSPTQKKLLSLSRELGEIFRRIGEEWVQTGEHFIPLKSGGQVNLKADSYPIVNLNNGNRIIIDVLHLLPEKMITLITSNWQNYKIVQLKEGDDLRNALGKILPLCGYTKIYPPGQALHLEGDVKIEITGDWIVETAPQDEDKKRLAVISITDSQRAPIPLELSDYLKGLGVTVIDFPPSEDKGPAPLSVGESLQPVFNKSDLVERMFRLSGQGFAKDVEIPVYQSRNTDFNLIVKADFLFQKDGVDRIVDLTGLGDSVLSLLREHQFDVLSLSNINDPVLIASRTLDFMGVKANSGIHPFMAADRDTQRNIKLSIPGITFKDRRGQTVFATEVSLPEEIAVFLKRRGYSLLGISFS